MRVSEFYYDLPKELIAQDPLEKRDNSKLLIIDKKTGNLTHKHFYDVIDYLNPGDALVLNESKVIPARLIGNLNDSDKICEIFLLKRIDANTWECLVKPGKKLRIGAKVNFEGGLLSAEIIDIKNDGNRVVRFIFDGIFEEVLDKVGKVPLPPYITHELKDKNRYQTVYAKYEGSVAAPTAGLHFTDELLDKIKNKGINIAKLTLHVSLGTFRPVQVDTLEEHIMHSEFVEIPESAANIINNAKDNNQKVICVGTTSCRSIESFAEFDNNKNAYRLRPTSGDTDIFIYPGYKFKMMDALITNFHLPESTLVMLVSAFSSKDIVFNAYKEAIENKYRFFSFGDACLFI